MVITINKLITISGYGIKHAQNAKLFLWKIVQNTRRIYRCVQVIFTHPEKLPTLTSQTRGIWQKWSKII